MSSHELIETLGLDPNGFSAKIIKAGGFTVVSQLEGAHGQLVTATAKDGSPYRYIATEIREAAALHGVDIGNFITDAQKKSSAA